MLKIIAIRLTFLLLSIFPMFAHAVGEHIVDDDKTSFINTIWVVGDHDAVAAAFEACAMFFGSGSMMGALMVSMMIALICMAVATVVQRNMQVFNYIVIFVLVMAIFSVKTPVYIASYFSKNPTTGKVTGGVIGAVPSHKVDNIPLGVAVPLGLMSNIAKIITEKFDTVFQDPSKSNKSYLVQGAEGYFSPLKQILKLRNQWNLPENQYIMQNLYKMMNKENGCSWSDGAEKLGQKGFRGLFLETPTIGRVHFTLAKLDPTNGKVLETQTVPMHCRTAAIILNKQLMQNIVPLTDVTGSKHSKVAENIAKSQNLSLNGASISDKEKTTLAENAAEIQGELDEIPSIAIDALLKTSSGSLTSISQDPISFLNQVWKVAERHNGNGDLEFTDLSREVPGFSPIGVTGTLTAAMQVNQAEIQANMIYGNLILNCLTNEKNCIQYNTLMLDARSKAAIDSAGEASMFQHYMHYGMNILLFIYVVMSPIMVIVIIAMGIQGWRLVKSYLLFSVWINSWLPLSIAIAYYQLHTYTTAIEKLASSLTSPEMILSPVVLNSILNGAQDTIATASTFMSSVPLIMLSLLGGSIYGLTQLAQKAGMTGKDYINEGFATQSSLDASTYAGGYAQALLASTNFRATSANALNAFQGPNQQDTVGITLKMSTSALKNVMDSKLAEVAMMESLSNIESFSDLMSYAEGQGKTVVIGLNEQGQFAVAMVDSADSSLTRNWQYAAQMKYGPGGMLTDVHNNIGVSDAVSIKRANGETVSLGSGYQFQKGDQLVINGTTETSEMFQTAIAQSTSDARKEAYAIQNTYAKSEGMESSIPLNSDLIEQAFFSSNGSTAFAYAVQEAQKYDGDFAQRLANAETPFDQYKVLVDGIHSKDENTFEAATRAASEYIGKANNVTNGLFISDQLLAYNLVQKNGAEAEEHVMAAYNSDISYSNANSVGTFENQKLNMSREEVIQKARSLPLGKEKMEQLYALQHDGRTVEQAHKLGEANMKYIQDTMSKLTQETIELGNKIQKNHGAEIAEEYWKNANYLLDKENGTTWDKVMGAVGVVTGMATYSLSKVPVLGTYFNQLLDIYSNELNTSQEGLTDQLRKLADTVKDPEKLQTAPLTKEIEMMVGAPKYSKEELATFEKNFRNDVAHSTANRTSSLPLNAQDKDKNGIVDSLVLPTNINTHHPVR